MVHAPVWAFLGHLLPIGPYGFVARFWTTHTVTILIRPNSNSIIKPGVLRVLSVPDLMHRCPAKHQGSHRASRVAFVVFYRQQNPDRPAAGRG